MATSGTTTFSLPLDELLEEASKQVGGDPILGTEARTARRALNLLFTDLQNRGILLHTLEQVQTTLTSAVATVTCDSDALDILDLVINLSSVDFPVERISWGEYLEIPRKTQTAQRPQRYFVDRQRDAPVITFWPVPDNSNVVAKYWKIRFIEDAFKLADDPDFPRRFWPALVQGLALWLARGRGLNFPLDRLMKLEDDFEKALANAMGEDRERTSLRVVPKLRRR